MTEQRRRGRPPRVIYAPIEDALPLKEKQAIIEITAGAPWVDGERKSVGDVLSVPESLAQHLVENGLAITR